MFDKIDYQRLATMCEPNANSRALCVNIVYFISELEKKLKPCFHSVANSIFSSEKI